MNKLKHLLDYKTLKVWGFVWVQKEDDGTVISYVIQKTSHTDMFGFEYITLMVFPDTHTHVKWHMHVGVARKTLFTGCIKNKSDLKCILKSTLIFKP